MEISLGATIFFTDDVMARVMPAEWSDQLYEAIAALPYVEKSAVDHQCWVQFNYETGELRDFIGRLEESRKAVKAILDRYPLRCKGVAR